MLIIGLTGSIATGKSTVSALLSSGPYSLPLIDADVLAREVVAPGTPGYLAIVRHFGPTTPDLLLPEAAPANESEDEEAASSASSSSTPRQSRRHDKPPSALRPLDRAALGRRVFGTTPQAQRDRAVLNGIVHPAVRRAMALAVLRAWLRGERAVVLDVPLLFESRLDAFCGAVVVVGVRDPQLQLRRLLARDGQRVERERAERRSQEEARRRRGRRLEQIRGHLAGGGGEEEKEGEGEGDGVKGVDGGSANGPRAMTRAEAEGRVASQGQIAWKVDRVHQRGERWGWVVWNDGSKAELEDRLAAVMGEVNATSPRWWGLFLWACPPLALSLAAWGFVRCWLLRWSLERKEKAAKGKKDK